MNVVVVVVDYQYYSFIKIDIDAVTDTTTLDVQASIFGACSKPG